MTLTKYKLGDLIELTTEINSDLQYGSKDVRGMTITKEIIPTKANVANTDLRKFLVVQPNEFAFNPRTHGKKIGFGYNDTNSAFIISWNNIAFRIKSDKYNTILAKYLFLHFNREEWDREACYCSWGSSTEVFTWEALCDMEISLPAVSVQQKYVDIYNALLANQKSYERGLSDLKLTCDAYIENLRKTSPCEKIGRYITESDRRNDLDLSVDMVRGLSNNKEIITTIADMDGVNLANYKLVEPDYFAYVTVTSRNGEKITLAHNETENTYIVSSSYSVFYVNKKDILLSNYLAVYFNRAEFDRYARFHSWGSAREIFNFSDLCDVEIPLPDIKIQKAIADIYTAYTTRKQINEKLKAQIKGVCPVLIKGSLEEALYTEEN